jgi:trimeric autotransporter adhesin
VVGEAFKTAGTGNWIIPSDRRLKENIVYLDSQQMLDKVLKMKGVSYNWIDKSRGTDKVIGFIAQDLQTVFPENVKTDKEGYLSASYGAYDPMIIESIKALKELIDDQRQEITNLKLRLAKTENLEAAKSDK